MAAQPVRVQSLILYCEIFMTTENDDRSNAETPTWTVLKILHWITGYLSEKQSESPRLDAEIILAYALEIERIQLYVQFERELLPEELATIRALVKRRAAKEPIAYIVGTQGFWSLDLKTDSRALIPRPDTEILIEAALKLLAEDSTASVVDIGTGSGAIALSLAVERPGLRIAATDIDANTLELARENADLHGLGERVRFFYGDLLDALGSEWPTADMIVSNPPYIAEDQRATLMADVREFEPSGALFSGADGLDILRRLVVDAFTFLTPGGHLLCEIGYDQGSSAREIFEQAGFKNVEVRKDYGGNDRVVLGQK